MNVKMPTIVGILTFMSRKNFMLCRVEHEKSFITSGPVDESVTCMRSSKMCEISKANRHKRNYGDYVFLRYLMRNWKIFRDY